APGWRLRLAGEQIKLAQDDVLLGPRVAGDEDLTNRRGSTRARHTASGFGRCCKLVPGMRITPRVIDMRHRPHRVAADLGEQYHAERDKQSTPDEQHPPADQTGNTHGASRSEEGIRIMSGSGSEVLARRRERGEIENHEWRRNVKSGYRLACAAEAV